MEESNSPKDFVWRFRLDEKPLNPLSSDPLLELIRVQWEELLKLCMPMCGDERVRVDGFMLLREAHSIHPIFPDDPRWKKDD